MMKQIINYIIIYTNRECSLMGPLMEVVSEATDLSVKIAYSRERLERFLRQVITTETIIVFFAFDQDDLFFLRSLRERAKDIKLILILPDKSKSTFSEGFLSYPRFITCSDNNFEDVSSVLKQIVKSNNHNKA